jgi:tetratricopeptide (TPR) repeat protein
MAKKNNKTEDQFQQVEEALTRTEQFIEDNQKLLIRIVGGVVLIIALFLGVKQFYLQPMQENAQADMYMAELYFQKDSFNLALNGDGQYYGFLDIIDDYSLSNAGNLANYYAGLSYLHLGEYENAIDYLKDFSSNDIILSSLALGCIGDAYMELGDLDEALNYYEDAADNSDNELTHPMYLFKQAMIHEQNEDALTLYHLIKVDFKSSREANGIEKYISRAENR